MRRDHVALLALLTVTLLACAAPQTHRFAFDYSPRQALRMIREILREQGYRIAVFDEPAGMLKTEHREFEGQEGQLVRYQFVISIVNPHELRVKVIPATALGYRDQIMETLLEPLKKAGLHPKYIPPPRSKPKYWKRPPSLP